MISAVITLCGDINTTSMSFFWWFVRAFTQILFVKWSLINTTYDILSMSGAASITSFLFWVPFFFFNVMKNSCNSFYAMLLSVLVLFSFFTYTIWAQLFTMPPDLHNQLPFRTQHTHTQSAVPNSSGHNHHKQQQTAATINNKQQSKQSILLYYMQRSTTEQSVRWKLEWMKYIIRIMRVHFDSVRWILDILSIHTTFGWLI